MPDKSAPHIVLLDCAEPSRNKAPQPCDIPSGVNVAPNDAGTEDCDAFNAILRITSFFPITRTCRVCFETRMM